MTRKDYALKIWDGVVKQLRHDCINYSKQNDSKEVLMGAYKKALLLREAHKE